MRGGVSENGQGAGPVGGRAVVRRRTMRRERTAGEKVAWKASFNNYMERSVIAVDRRGNNEGIRCIL